VKKSRKLTRLFGETPDGDMLSQKDSALHSRPPKLDCLSTALALDLGPLVHIHTTTSRRHSTPLTPDEFFLHSFPHNNKSKASSWAGEHVDPVDGRSYKMSSFIDLSDDEVDYEAVSPITFAPNLVPLGSHPLPSPSQLSLYDDAMTPEQCAEEQRRRNREKIAKLHRFLGSRVPPDLVFGLALPDPSLPPIQPSMPAQDADSRKQWLRRRHSSSAGSLPSWSDDIDRMKEDLNDKEKAINVRRAQKMEKVCVPPARSMRASVKNSYTNSLPIDVRHSTSADLIPYPPFPFTIDPTRFLSEEVQIPSRTILRRIYTSWGDSVAHISAAKPQSLILYQAETQED
jgi:hypothetical protein